MKEYRAKPPSGTSADLEMLQKLKLGAIPVWDWEEVSCNVLVQRELLSGILHPFPAMQITAGGLHYQHERVKV